jgi:hypothetical protein
MDSKVKSSCHTEKVLRVRRMRARNWQIVLGAHIPVQHGLAPCPGLGPQEPTELLCALEIVGNTENHGLTLLPISLQAGRSAHSAVH